MKELKILIIIEDTEKNRKLWNRYKSQIKKEGGAVQRTTGLKFIKHMESELLNATVQQ